MILNTISEKYLIINGLTAVKFDYAGPKSIKWNNGRKSKVLKG